MTLEKVLANLILHVIDEAIPGRSTVHASSSAANGTSCLDDEQVTPVCSPYLISREAASSGRRGGTDLHRRDELDPLILGESSGICRFTEDAWAVPKRDRWGRRRPRDVAAGRFRETGIQARAQPEVKR